MVGLGGVLVVVCWLHEQLVEVAREVALEAAQRALSGFAFGLFAPEVMLGLRVVLGAGDGDDVQRVVELAVPAAVEAGSGRCVRRTPGSGRAQRRARAVHRW
jgi:hypothetical protein